MRTLPKSATMTVRRLILYLRTARHLKPSQLFYFLLRRSTKRRNVRVEQTPTLRSGRRFVTPCPIAGVFVDDSTFRFLNVEFDLLDENGEIDWSAPSRQLLWKYNLHYFDFLRETSRSAENSDRLIRSWILRNPQGHEVAWAPFTTSLRIVNWVFYLRQRPVSEIPRDWLDSLFTQACWLERNDERHLLANHYFENLKALFFAGCFFGGTHAARWLKRAQKEIVEQLEEQTLSDGGHFERSPQYHCLMLENYLDIYNFAQSHPDICTKPFVEAVRAYAVRSLNWLATTIFPDGSIPLFNDSAFGVAISPSDLFAYAERLSLKFHRPCEATFELIDQPDSGFFGCRLRDDMFVVDCGDIGPRYQPGHTHCDFLSYELMFKNQRIVVDTGVCEYEPGPARAYVRSTEAHNTVSVSGGEQSELWGAFRVARRAKKLYASIEKADDDLCFRGAYRGFYTVGRRIEHHRTALVSLTKTGTDIRSVAINDRVIGHGHHTVESFIHFNPAISLIPHKSGLIEIWADSSKIASVQFDDNVQYRVVPSIFCPEFGKQIPNHTLVLSHSGRLPVSLDYRIVRDTI